MLPMYSDHEKDLQRHAFFPRRYRCLIRIVFPLIGVYLLYLIVYRPENWIPETSPYLPESHSLPSYSSDGIWLRRQQRVRKAFQHAWSAYVRDAWGCDEYHPISRRGSNLTTQGIGFTIIDSLDTLLLMNLTDEFHHARDWVANELDFDIDGEVNLFETTIRVLGGLLSAYNLSEDMEFLSKAVDLADRLLGAFLSPTAIPYASVNLRRKSGIEAHFASGASSTSEVTTLQLEFKYLSHLTGDENYWTKVEETIFKIDSLERVDGLVPIYISPNEGLFWGSKITLGARGDSYYEYLLKQYIQTSRTEPMYRRMYDQAMQGVRTHLVDYSRPSKLLFVGELLHPTSTSIIPKMDHLVCFLGGNLALGATEGRTIRSREDYNALSKNAKEDLRIGTKLTETCAQMYFTTATGLAPEIVYFNTDKTSVDDLYIKPMDSHSLLRPETVESLFVLWRITRDVKYRDWGWKIFEAFEKYAKHEKGGYTSLDDVTSIPPGRRDKMETFWLAETLKYLYLLFDDTDVLPLDKYVFNTEAHPLPIFMPSEEVRGAGWSRS